MPGFMVRVKLYVTCIVVLLLPHHGVQDGVEGPGLSVPEARFDPVNRRLVADGDVLIAALLPITRADGESGSCINSKPVSNFILHFIEPFLFVLRSHNFSLSARLPNGSWTHLRLGYVIGDQCRGGDVTDSVKFALDITNPLAKEAPNCPDRQNLFETGINSGKKPVLGLVGPWQEDRKVSSTAPITAASQIVQIAPRITRDEFSCTVPSSSDGDCSMEPYYQYLFRTAASDRYQAYAVADLLRFYNWTHFAVVVAQDITNVVLLETFLKQVKLYGLCPAFVAHLDADSKESAIEVDSLLRKHSAAKVVVMFSGRKAIKLLIETIWSISRQRNEGLPRLWIGNDKWDSAIDIAYEHVLPQHVTIEGSIALWPLVPKYFDDWQWPPRLMRQLMDFMLNITAGDLRRNPGLTGNPLLCRAMEEFNSCSGVCPDHPGASHPLPRCNDNTSLPDLHPYLLLKIADLIDPFTMLSTEILLQSLQQIFQETVSSSASLSQEELRQKFYQNSKGSGTRDAMKRLKFPCHGSERCEVFPGNFQELVPQYVFTTIDFVSVSYPVVGTWRATNFTISPGSVQMKMDFGPAFFGRKLYPKSAWKDLPPFVSGNVSVPTSSCTPVCKAGWGKLTAPNPQPVCCHVCKPCVGQQYSSGGSIADCKPCEPGFAANMNKTQCIPLPVEQIRDQPILFGLSMLMVIVCEALFGGTIVLFVRFANSDVVRFDQKLSLSILLAMVVSTLGCGIHLISTTSTACTASRLLTIIPAMWMSCCVLVKTSRLARIHFITKKLKSSVRRRWSLTTSAQVLAIFGVLLIGLPLELFTIFADPPRIYYSHEADVTLAVCLSSETGVAPILVDTYLLSLIILTVVLAFFTRKLPLNFNEARLLFMESFTQCAIWAILRPPYYLATLPSKEKLDQGLVFLNVIAIWLWLYLPRCYALLVSFYRHKASHAHTESSVDTIDHDPSSGTHTPPSVHLQPQPNI